MTARIGRSRGVPARYVFAAVAMLGTFFNIQTLCFPPVALPAMVRRNSTDTYANDTVDVCIFGQAGQNSSSQVHGGEFDWDEAMQGYVMSAMAIGLVPSMIVAGRLVEIWSPKLLVAVSTVMGVLFTMLFPVFAKWDVNALIVSQLAAGLLMGAPIPAINAMLSSWFPPDERQKLAGITFAAQSLGVITANGITGKLVDSMDWQFAFYVIPSSQLVWLLLWHLCVYDTPEKHPRISQEELAYLATSNVKEPSQTLSVLPWRQMLSSPPIWAHVTMALAPSWIFNTYVNNLPTYMVDVLHYSTTQAGYLLTIPQLFFWMSAIAFGFISQWVKSSHFMGHLLSYHIFNGISTLGSAACLATVPLVGCSEVAILVLLVAAMACSGAYMGGSKLNHMDLAINYAGTLSGVQAAFDISGAVLAPIVNGLVTNHQQTLSAWSKVFYISAAVNVFFFVVYLIIGSVEEQPWNRSMISQDNEDKEKGNQASTDDVIEISHL
ncbi:sialin-like isoform X2 [Bacillus rossius redtenbacheri]|uniref:sialin-like isoform X2 n=1 Tax=Bacillus rossius redtenbacheri TaxID=93214 RepID=UPI002FDD8DFE